MRNPIDKEKLIETVNALSVTGDVYITIVEIFGQDDVDGNYLEVRLPGDDELILTGFDGETFDEILVSIVREINSKLDELAEEIRGNKLKLKSEASHRKQK